MDWYVTLCALAACIICFLIYAMSVIVTMLAKPQAAHALVDTAKSIAATQPKGIAEDYSKLLESASKLTDSLSKAGPTPVSLIGTILFILIAAVSSGVLRNAPPPAFPNVTSGTATR